MRAEDLDPDEIERAYVQALRHGAEKVNQSRIMFVGHSGVGKTSLKLVLLGKEINPEHDSTIGIDATKVEITHAHDWKEQLSKDTFTLETCKSVAFLGIINDYYLTC